mgnify:CR=1 FL=1
MIKRVLQNTFSLLNVDYVKLTEKWNYLNVISPYFRIYYIDDGNGEVSDPSGSLKLEPGYLYIIPSFTLCNLHCNGYLSQYFVQFFEESVDGSSLFARSRNVAKVKAKQMDIDAAHDGGTVDRDLQRQSLHRARWATNLRAAW